MYEQTIKIEDNESIMKVNKDTGEVKEVKKRLNNIPNGKSLLDYTDFSIVNNKALNALSTFLTNEEIGIITKMINRADFNSNSLKPLSDETSIRSLAEEFSIGKNKVSTIFKRLFEIGVYAHIRIHEDNLSEYWILNPYISWKGKLKDDSIFAHFSSTKIAKLIQ